MFCIKALALILLFVSYVFGAREHCGDLPTFRSCKNILDCYWYLGEYCNKYGWCDTLLRPDEPLVWYQREAKSTTDKACKRSWNCKWWKGEKCVEGICRDRIEFFYPD